MLSAGFMLVVCVGWGIGPLSDGASVQVGTYVDGGHPDQPALYALLADVMAWEPGDEAGAVVPDWGAIGENPAVWRGRALLIEGTDAGRWRRIELVRSQKPWGAAVTEWGVVVGSGLGDPDPAAGEGASQDVAGLAAEGLPVVVWFVDPDDAMGAAVHGRRVRLAARFLGWWDDADARGVARRYPVVVARSAAVVAAPAGRLGGGAWVWPGLAAVGVLGGLWLWWRVGRAVGRSDVVAQRRARRQALPDGEEGGGGDVDVELPDDPASALGVLEGRRGSE